MLIYCNIPMHTCDTTARVPGMLRCAEIEYRTCTRATRLGKPVGFPIPVPNPIWRPSLDKIICLPN